jgi:S-layer homology domain
VLRARLATVLSLAILAASALSIGVVAAEPDPLGLTLDGGVAEGLGIGTDTIAVWVCEVPGTTNPKTFTPDDVATWANTEIAPFWTTISRGRYTAVFEAAGTFTRQTDCLDEAIALTTDARFSNTFVIDNTDGGGGLGGSGIWYLVNGQVITGTLDDTPATSDRGFYVFGGMFDLPATAAHEIGHTLAWPHSGSGTTGLAQYDNVADLMSGHGIDNLCPIGGGISRGPCWITHTIAFNRYTSGWIDPGDIELVTKPVELDLVGPEAIGPQMALLPSADPLIFSTIEARPAIGYDENSGVPGVVLHTIDQTASCDADLCWGLSRRQNPAVGAASTEHILGVGESAVVHGMTITVTAATADGYAVTVAGAPQGCAMGPNRFTDVSETSFAYNDIGCIRLLGITTGTSATTYSPDDGVTREQMAAFLGRLFRGLGNGCSTAPTPFVDIVGSFAAADIACIYGLGVTTGTSPSTYAPAGIVTREQMAAFLGRLWRDALGNGCSTAPTPFVDIVGSFAAADIACIYALGVTTGTSSTTFEPSAVVTREQMAAFLARFWKIA